MYRMILNYIKGYKKNSIMIIMGIAFSVMLMFSLIQMGDSILVKFKECATYGSVRDFQINKLDDNQMSKIEQEIEKDKLSHKVDCYLKSAFFGTSYLNNNLSLGELVAVEGDIDVFWQTKLIKGSMIKNDYDIVLEKSYVDNMGEPCNVGDIINIQINDDEGNIINKEFRVSGIIEDISISSGYNYLLTTYNTYKDIEKNSGLICSNDNKNIQILVDKDNYNIDNNIDVQFDIQKLLNINMAEFNKNYIQINEYKEEIYAEKGVFNSIGYSFKALTLIITICMIVFVYNTINISLIEKIKQYGAMRCVGLSKKQLRKMIISEVIFYSVFGISIGIFLGNIINAMVGNKIVSLVMVEDFGITISQNIWSYILVIIMTVLAISIAMIKIIMNISKLSPINALNYCEASNYSDSKNLRDEKTSFIIKFARRNIDRNRTKSRTLLITLVISSSLLIIILNGYFLLDYTKMDSSKSDIAQYELFTDIYNEGYFPREDTEKLKEEKYVSNVYGQLLLMGISAEDFNKTSEKNLITIAYNDEMFKELINTNDSLKGINYLDDEVAVLSLPDENVKEISTLTF